MARDPSSWDRGRSIRDGGHQWNSPRRSRRWRTILYRAAARGHPTLIENGERPEDRGEQRMREYFVGSARHRPPFEGSSRIVRLGANAWIGGVDSRVGGTSLRVRRSEAGENPMARARTRSLTVRGTVNPRSKRKSGRRERPPRLRRRCSPTRRFERGSRRDRPAHRTVRRSRAVVRDTNTAHSVRRPRRRRPRAEPFADESFERDPPRRDVAPVCSRREFDARLAFEGRERLRLDEGDLAGDVAGRRGVGPVAGEVTIAAETPSGDGVDALSCSHVGAGFGGDVDREDGAVIGAIDARHRRLPRAKRDRGPSAGYGGEP